MHTQTAAGCSRQAPSRAGGRSWFNEFVATTILLFATRQVDVGAGVEQRRDDRQAAPAGDGVVQAAVVVDVDAPVEEPPQLRLLTPSAWPLRGGRVRDG
jgi:hypothetical protein